MSKVHGGSRCGIPHYSTNGNAFSLKQVYFGAPELCVFGLQWGCYIAIIVTFKITLPPSILDSFCAVFLLGKQWSLLGGGCLCQMNLGSRLNGSI